jgi:hypothetical protein
MSSASKGTPDQPSEKPPVRRIARGPAPGNSDRERLHPVPILSWLAATFFFSWLMCIQISKDYYAQTCDGEVIDKRITTRRSSKNYYVHFSYDIDGQRRYAQESVGSDTYYRTIRPSPEKPGTKLKVNVAKLFGLYYANIYIDQYHRNSDLILLPGLAAFSCLVISLYWIFRPRIRAYMWNAPLRTRNRRSAAGASDSATGGFPPELLQLLPRAIAYRQPSRRAPSGCLVAFLPLALGGAYLMYLLLRLMRSEVFDGCGIVVLSIVVIAWNGFLLSMFYSVVIHPGVDMWLCQWGQPVTGRIVRKWQRKWWTRKPVNYLDCEFLHPRFGRRIARVAVEKRPYEEASEGQRVTVLCFPGRRWPTLVYEHGWFFQCRVDAALSNHRPPSSVLAGLPARVD